MTLDRKARLEAARDRSLAITAQGATHCLLGEGKGLALDLSRLGPRPLAAVIAALGAPSSEPIACAPVGEGAFGEALGALAHACRAARIEHGQDDLGIGFPWLEGRTPDGTPIRAPLFIYPATLEPAREGHWQWLLGVTGAPWLNESLAAHFRRVTRVRLSYEDFLAQDEDGLFKADEPTWLGFIKALNRAGVTLADTAQTLPERPVRFDRYDDKSLDLIPPGQFRLSYQIVLARLSMIHTGIAADLENALANPLDEFTLAGAATLLDIDPQNPGSAGRVPARAANDRGAYGPLRRWQVLPTDPYQEDALRVLEDIKEGGLCVVGPPGTGKSQLVANLIAASIQRGDRVLFASARRGALGDVEQRLADRGLAEPVATVLDPWRDRGPLCTSLFETLDPIVNTLEEVKSAHAESDAVGALERQLSERVGNADTAWDYLVGADQRYLGLAHMDEHALLDPIDDVPDLTAEVEAIGPGDLEAALDDIGHLAPHAAPFVAPHPLSLRTDWSSLDDAGVRGLYERIARARRAIAAWSELTGPLMPAELDRLRPVFGKIELALDLARCDDPDRLRAHAEVREWLGDATSTAAHRQMADELRAAASERQKITPELVRLSADELAQRIAALDKLHKHETSGLRVFTPAYWSLKKLPEKYLATLPPETPREAAPLAALHREAEAWQRLLATLPELPAFALDEVGDPQLVFELVDRLEHALDEADSEAAVAKAFGGRFPARPDWVNAPPSRRSQSPFLVGLCEEEARAAALTEIYEALDPLEPYFDAAWFKEVRLFARDVPHEAEERLKIIADTRQDGLKVGMLDRTTAGMPTFVGRFLRVWAGPPELAVRACRRAVHEGWKRHRATAWGGTGIEAPLVDPRELRALADTMTKLEDARAAFALARWRERLGALMDVESQRQDLTKIVGEVGRKRLRATLKQLVERHWKRGLAQLRPAWLCPLDAVASIFPRDRDTFDLIIVDEAQRASVDAVLPALFRGRRMLFLGDPLQAPPKPETPTASEPSALSVAMGAFPTAHLRWGWGVRKDELWELPDAGWYAGSVICAPNTERREVARCEGLHWTKVDGRWKDGENTVEAEKVADRVVEVMSDKIGEFPPSLAVVTGTRAQAALVRAAIDRRAAKDEAFRELIRADRDRPEHEQLVVGDLEETPPDARDVIILSFTWAPAEGSKRVVLELGQLLAADGDGLLAGIIARARHGLHLVASFHDAAIDAGRRPELGAKLLAGVMAHTYGVALKDERITRAALADVAAATGIARKLPEAMAGVGDVVRERIAEEFGERGLGISIEPLPGPVAPDLTIAATPKSPARVALQTTRFMLEPDTFVRDLWARRFWQRQGWTLIRVTPGVWRSSPTGVVRAIEKLFSLPARLDERISAAAQTRAEVEKLRAEYEAARAFEHMRKQAAEREAADALEQKQREAAEELARKQRLAEEARLRAMEAERLAAEQAEAERVAAEQAAIEQAEAERVAAEQAAIEQAEAAFEAERLASEAALADEAERIAAEQAEAERLALEAAEAERAAQAKLARAAAQRAARAKAEAERIAAEDAALMAEVERVAREAAEADRRAAQEQEQAHEHEHEPPTARTQEQAHEPEQAPEHEHEPEPEHAPEHEPAPAPAPEPEPEPDPEPEPAPPQPVAPSHPVAPPIAPPPPLAKTVPRPPTATLAKAPAKPPSAPVAPIAPPPPAAVAPIAKPPSSIAARPPAAPIAPPPARPPAATPLAPPRPAAPPIAPPPPPLAKAPTAAAPIAPPPAKPPIAVAPPPLAKPPGAIAPPLAKPPGAIAPPLVKPPGAVAPPLAKPPAPPLAGPPSRPVPRPPTLAPPAAATTDAPAPADTPTGPGPDEPPA